MRESYDDIFNTNPRYSTTIGFILGLVLVDSLTAPEQNMLGNWIILIGQTILTNAASQNIIESRISGGIININSKEVKCIYNPIIYDINKIRKKRGLTVIVIAHRLSTIKDADCILFMKKGKISERGTHDELINNNGDYKVLIDKQLVIY